MEASVMEKLRKDLCAPGLLSRVRRCFVQIRDHRVDRCVISLADTLMSGLAVFSLKCASLLQYDQHRQDETIAHNLRTLYGVEQTPCDSQMREIIDEVETQALRPAFNAVFSQLQRGKGLEAYAYLNGYYLLSVDGTGFFSSETIHCEQCCEKKKRNGQITYYHQLLGAAIVHPDKREVIPLCPEPITRQDGQTKNDCERNAAKRLLPAIRREHPHLRLLVVEDALAANAPHIELLKKLDMRFILGVKPGDHQALFEEVEARARANQVEEWEFVDASQVTHRFGYTNQIALNQQHPDLLINFLEYWEIRPEKTLHFTWITDFFLTKENVFLIQRGGRARWKIENETFNTLKNQGYNLEHNYGHGQQNLANNFALLMMLAFLLDQVQQIGCPLFQQALVTNHSKISLWEKMRAFFRYFYIDTWERFFAALIKPIYTPLPDTS